MADISGFVAQPTGLNSNFDKRKIRGSAALAENDIVYVTGVNGEYVEVAKAGNTGAAKFSGLLYRVLQPSSSGLPGQGPQHTTVGSIFGMVEDVDTSSATVGDPVYLSTSSSGAWTLTKPTDGPVRCIGFVTEVSASAGAWQFCGVPMTSGQVAKGSGRVLAFTKTVSGVDNVTFSPVELGGSYGNAGRAFAMTDSATIYAIGVTWSSHTATVKFSASFTGECTLLLTPDAADIP